MYHPNNAIIHFCPDSPFIAKALVNIREDKKIVLRFVVKDVQAARACLGRSYPDIPVRVFTHKGG